MTIPVISNFAARVYDKMRPVAIYDVDLDYPLMTFIGAIGELVREIDDIARQDELGNPQWSALLDVDRCPAFALGWLAQLAGVSLDPGLSEARQRERIKSTGGWNRGRVSSVEAAARQYLTGTRAVILRERDGSAYHFTIITRKIESPSDIIATEWSTPYNLEQNPKLANNATDWIVSSSAGITNLGSGRAAMPDISTEWGWRVHAQQPNDSTSRSMGISRETTTRIPATPDKTHTISFDIYPVDAGATGLRLEISWYNSGGSVISTSQSGLLTPILSTRTRLSYGAVAPSNAATFIWRVAYYTASPNDIVDMYVTKALIERGTDTVYFDGDMFNYQWEGTANASRTLSPIKWYSPQLRAALLEQKPAGLTMNDEVLLGQDYQQIFENYGSYQEIYDLFTTYDDILTTNP